MSHFDLCTNQCELEVQRIIHFQNLANQLSFAFIDTKKLTKSHIPSINTSARIDVPKGQLANESQIHLKCRRLIGSEDLTPWKRRTQRKMVPLKKSKIKK